MDDQNNSIIFGSYDGKNWKPLINHYGMYAVYNILGYETPHIQLTTDPNSVYVESCILDLNDLIDNYNNSIIIDSLECDYINVIAGYNWGNNQLLYIMQSDTNNYKYEGSTYTKNGYSIVTNDGSYTSGSAVFKGTSYNGTNIAGRISFKYNTDYPMYLTLNAGYYNENGEVNWVGASKQVYWLTDQSMYAWNNQIFEVRDGWLYIPVGDENRANPCRIYLHSQLPAIEYNDIISSTEYYTPIYNADNDYDYLYQKVVNVEFIDGMNYYTAELWLKTIYNDAKDDIFIGSYNSVSDCVFSLTSCDKLKVNDKYIYIISYYWDAKEEDTFISYRTVISTDGFSHTSFDYRVSGGINVLGHNKPIIHEFDLSK